MSEMFNELLQMARNQDQPQRMLLLFAKADEVKTKRKGKECKGTIVPVMCVDKLPEELTTFEDIVNEADSVSKEWDFMLIASLSGENQITPSSEDAEPFLNQMTNDVASGNDLTRYVIFDRQQNPIEMQTR
ncbi:MAG: ribonucleotide reductase subunit alpha [Kangiellaceae bacterium]|nr:ribonucleotide reductase subunit alpha [Kangiellaceae bacterium]